MTNGIWFDEIMAKRSKKSSIEESPAEDGRNYVRAGNDLFDHLEKPTNHDIDDDLEQDDNGEDDEHEILVNHAEV